MSVRVMIQKFGSKLSNMVIPNLGALIAWGLLTAVGIGINNEMLRGFVTPMLNYLLPLLIYLILELYHLLYCFLLIELYLYKYMSFLQILLCQYFLLLYL